MHKLQKNNNRIYFFIACLLIVSSLVVYRLFTLTFLRHEALAESAKSQQDAAGLQLTGRGSIYGFDLSSQEAKVLATNQKGAKGIERFYPKGNFAAHVLGFVGFKGFQRVGQYGVEGHYDDVLGGAEGKDVVLTIDPQIQEYVEARLDELLKRYSSPRGTIIVQEPSSGAILAMASSPSFDPNHYRDYSLSTYLNPAVQAVFEPGSSFKSVTMAAGINAGSVTPTTTYTDTGEVLFGSYSIKNFDEKSFGLQTMRNVLEKSLNTGVMFVQRKMGEDTFLNYVVAFGFGQKTGVDLSGEVSGNISNLYENRAINFATASFGQGIAVTPLQLISAYSAIANGGKLMRPYIVKEVVHGNGEREVTQPKVLGAPITEKTAAQLQSMLVGVVDEGFDKAAVKGYDVAGKTGTAQIPDKDGGYLGDKQYIHNFVGFAPAYNPRFTVLIKIDRPQGITFASRSLSPTFGEIAYFLLRYFKIPPTR